MEAPRRDQIKESKLGLHLGIKESLKILCCDPNTDVVILSGSKKDILDEVPSFPSCMLLGLLYHIQKVFFLVWYDCFCSIFLAVCCLSGFYNTTLVTLMLLRFKPGGIEVLG